VDEVCTGEFRLAWLLHPLLIRHGLRRATFPRCAASRLAKANMFAAPCSLPLQGKGDRAAVDEVLHGGISICVASSFSPHPSRLAPCHLPEMRSISTGEGYKVSLHVVSLPLRGRGTAQRWMRCARGSFVSRGFFVFSSSVTASPCHLPRWGRLICSPHVVSLPL